MGECAAAIGPEAYSLLLASAKEGQIVLPKYLTLRLSNALIDLDVNDPLTSLLFALVLQPIAKNWKLIFLRAEISN